jgi:hypothetical protein
MEWTCDIFRAVIDDHKNIGNILEILFDHLIESFVDA